MFLDDIDHAQLEMLTHEWSDVLDDFSYQLKAERDYMRASHNSFETNAPDHESDTDAVASAFFNSFDWED